LHHFHHKAANKFLIKENKPKQQALVRWCSNKRKHDVEITKTNTNGAEVGIHFGVSALVKVKVHEFVNSTGIFPTSSAEMYLKCGKRRCFSILQR